MSVSSVSKFLLFAVALMAIGLRFFEGMPNVNLVGALALSAGLLLPIRNGLPLVLITLLISDLLLELSTGYGLHNTMFFTYSAYALMALGAACIKAPNFLKVSAGAGVASLFFFVWSNLGVWLVGGLYPLTANGLAECYIAAIPFARAEVFSTLIGSAAIFTAYKALSYKLNRIAPAHS